MKMIRTFALIATVGISVFSANGAGFSRLEAISLIETADDDAIVGRRGEVSRYQIMPRVWHQYTLSKAYHDPRVSRCVAEQHLERIEKLYRQKNGRPATEFDIYVIWNGGLAYYARRGFSPGRLPQVVRERALRFVNLRQLDLTLQARAR